MQFVVQMVMEITTDPEDQQGARTVPHPLRPNLQHKEKGHIGTDDPVEVLIMMVMKRGLGGRIPTVGTTIGRQLHAFILGQLFRFR